MIRKIVLFLLLLTYHNLAAQLDTLYICEPGDEIQLEVKAGAFAYLWSSASSLSNPRIYNPIAKPFVNTTYIAEIINNAESENLVENPDFSLGNVGFTSDYEYGRIVIKPGAYGVDFSPADVNPVFFERCTDKTDGSGQMMIIDGAPINEQKVWCQSVKVKPDTDYVFTCWLATTMIGNPAQLKFSINDQGLGNAIKAPEEVCVWTQFYSLWNSGSVDSANICIVNTNVRPDGNDFALDDFSFYEVEQVSHDTTVVLIEGLLEAENKRVFIPSAFSPNDDGYNDRFEVFLGKGTEFIKQIKIFDAWGNQIFSKINCLDKNLDCFWDGLINQEAAREGAYIYLIDVLFTNKQVVQFRGSVQLLR